MTFYIYRVGGLALQGTFYISELAKTLLSLEVTRFDRPRKVVRPPSSLLSDRLQAPPGQTARRTGSDRLAPA
jgi:hypothetical protein